MRTMDYRKFALESVQPTGASVEAFRPPNAWDEAVNFYGTPVLRTLQSGGARTVGELFELTKSLVNVQDLNMDQFGGVISEMANRGLLEVTERVANLADCKVALPIRRR